MLLTETQILPPISVFTQALSNGGLMIEAHENYQKKSMRNRFFLASPNGRIGFSIPLKKGKSKQLSIKEVLISYDENWIKNLDHTVTTLLKNSAYFEFYYQPLMKIFNSKCESLWELNQKLLIWIIEACEMDLNLDYTKEYIREYKAPNEDLRNKPLSFYNNPSSKVYIEYDQIFMMEHGFICNLSILDLLMNRGPETGVMLKYHATSIL